MEHPPFWIFFLHLLIQLKYQFGGVLIHCVRPFSSWSGCAQRKEFQFLPPLMGTAWGSWLAGCHSALPCRLLHTLDSRNELCLHWALWLGPVLEVRPNPELLPEVFAKDSSSQFRVDSQTQGFWKCATLFRGPLWLHGRNETLPPT